LANLVVPLWQPLWQLTRPNGPSEAQTNGELCERLIKGSLDREVLESGRDFFGCGTLADPFRFRAELQYHWALHTFLKQEGLRFGRIERLETDTGRIERVVTADSRELYFSVT
jgi:hypothetical protein